MTLAWDDNKDTIIRLYITDGKKLLDVQKIMLERHNFRASVRSYRQHFDRWRVGKYRCRKRQQHWARQNNNFSDGMASPTYSVSRASSFSTELIPHTIYPVDTQMVYPALDHHGQDYGVRDQYHEHGPFNEYSPYVAGSPTEGSPKYSDHYSFDRMPIHHQPYVGLHTTYEHEQMNLPNRRAWSIRDSLSLQGSDDGHREYDELTSP